MKKRLFALLMAQLLVVGSVTPPVYAAGNFAEIRMHTRSGSSLQRFYLEQVSFDKATAGAAVVQGTWKGALCQRWRIVEKENNTIALKNCEGYYLEMSSNTPANGVKLRLNNYKSAKRFMWVRKNAASA